MDDNDKTNKHELDQPEPAVVPTTASQCWYCIKPIDILHEKHVIFVEPQPTIRVQFIHDTCLVQALQDHMEWWDM